MMVLMGEGKGTRMVGGFTRGFRGRGKNRDPRLPPGQYDTGKSWPTLTAEATPKLDTATWTFTINGLVGSSDHVDLGRDPRAPAVHVRGRHPLRHDVVQARHDVHRRLDRHAARRSRDRSPSATHVLANCHTGYTTNLPLADVTGGKAWVAFEADGEPLKRQHGGPARLLVPHLYFWKSAKWVSGLELLDHDEPGFWERNGYHDRGDPWLEQRYQGD